MAAPLSFNDLEKKINSLIFDDYFYNKNIKLKTTNSSDIDWTAAGTLSPSGTIGEVSAVYLNPNGFSLENFKIKTDGRVMAEASLKFTESLKFNASIEDGRQEPGKPLRSFGILGMNFQSTSGNVAIQGDVDVVNGPTFYGSSVLKYNDCFKFGIETRYNTHYEEKQDTAPELMDLNFGGAYMCPDWTFSARTTDLLENIRLSYVHSVAADLDVGALVDYRVKSNHQSLAIAMKWMPDQQTVVKGKVDSDAIFSASFRQRLSKFLQLTFCAEVDGKEMGAEGHKFGIGLEFE